MSRGGLLPAARAVAWRNLHNFFTNPALLLPAVIFPLFFFTAFAGGLSRIDNVPGFDFAPGYTAFQFVFVLCQSAAFGGVFNGFSVARDFESGFARRLLLAAPRREGILLGYVVAALVRALFTITLITVVALVVGMRIEGDGVDLVGLYTLAVLLNIATSLWGAGVAMRLRTMQAGPAMQMPVFVTLFLAPVYVPLDLLSGWIHAVASVNPLTALLQAGRSFVAGQPEEVALAFTVAAGLIAVFAVWGLRGLRSAERAGA
jgi:ABC-2 type transport system permease protein